MAQLRVLAILTFSLSLCSFGALSDQYVIGVEDMNYYPQFGFDSNSNPVGYFKDLIAKFEDYSQHTFIFEPLPVHRLYNQLISGSIDFKYPDRPEWKNYIKVGYDIIYSDNIARYTDGILVKDNHKNISLLDLKSLATVQGFTPHGYLDAISYNFIKMQTFDSAERVIFMLMNDKTDGAYLNIDVAKYLAEQKFGYENKTAFLEELPHITAHYLMSTIKFPEVISEFNRFLEEHEQEITKLKDHYSIQ